MNSPAEVRITNIDELTEISHKCTSIDTLINLQISLARMEEAFTNLTCSTQDMKTEFAQAIREVKQALMAPHLCKYEDLIKKNNALVEKLVSESSENRGKAKWEARIDRIIDGVIIAVVVASLLFFMKGGSI